MCACAPCTYTGKFNCIVPGTLFTNTIKCPSSTTSSSEATPSVPVMPSTVVNTASETSSNFDNLFRFDVGGLLLYVVVAVGSVLVITFTLCLAGLCVSLCYKKQCKRKCIAILPFYCTNYSLFLD